MDVIKKTSKKDSYKILLDLLQQCGIIQPDFTGKLTISCTCGGVNYVEKTETFK